MLDSGGGGMLCVVSADEAALLHARGTRNHGTLLSLSYELVHMTGTTRLKASRRLRIARRTTPAPSSCRARLLSHVSSRSEPFVQLRAGGASSPLRCAPWHWGKEALAREARPG